MNRLLSRSSQPSEHTPSIIQLKCTRFKAESQGLQRLQPNEVREELQIKIQPVTGIFLTAGWLYVFLSYQFFHRIVIVKSLSQSGLFTACLVLLQDADKLRDDGFLAPDFCNVQMQDVTPEPGRCPDGPPRGGDVEPAGLCLLRQIRQELCPAGIGNEESALLLPPFLRASS